jgi:hypothetical protein
MAIFQKTVCAGEPYTIPPGHVALAEEMKSFMGIELMSAEQYEKPNCRL